MDACVPQAMAQFVLKIEKLSHIMGTGSILEMTHAYGLGPRLWLLIILIIYGNPPQNKNIKQALFFVSRERGLALIISICEGVEIIFFLMRG